MKTEHSPSQNQAHETTTSTSDKRYQNSLANAVHDSQQAFGLEKYGITLDQVPEDKYDWQLMALEESVDMNQYNVREIRRLTNVITALHSLVDSKDEEIRLLKQRLAHQKHHMQSKDSIIGSIDDQIQKAKERVAHGLSD